MSQPGPSRTYDFHNLRVGLEFGQKLEDFQQKLDSNKDLGLEHGMDENVGLFETSDTLVRKCLVSMRLRFSEIKN